LTTYLAQYIKKSPAARPDHDTPQGVLLVRWFRKTGFAIRPSACFKINLDT
jgi:hypothetical protein